MRSIRRLAALLALLLPLSACVMGRAAPEDPTMRATVRVENRRFADMNIYALRGTQRVRLGTATGLSTRVLTIPANLLLGPTPLRFLADPIGGDRTPVSYEITVSPGDEVVLTITP